jgi:hypothetical protein
MPEDKQDFIFSSEHHASQSAFFLNPSRVQYASEKSSSCGKD